MVKPIRSIAAADRVMSDSEVRVVISEVHKLQAALRIDTS